MMKLSPDDVEISEKSVVDLFRDGIRAEATLNDYTNKLKKVLCEYLGDILHGDPKKVDYLKIFSIFFRLSFPITKKKAPTPNNTVGIAKYRISDIGSPHILSITITSI